jgi:ATP/maltotriose-dependent transcriptional regulator MalT
LLARYYSARDGAVERLPASLAELVRSGRSSRVVITADTGELEVRVVADPGIDAPAMLLFEERRAPGDYAPLRTLGLSEREAEVLYWISQGKSNPEIGIIIGAAAGTVKKHAENIFAKLQIEGRSTAMLVALDVLRAR